ncbi:type I restriction endonuclease subunit R [Xylanibacter muris]|uniref:type I restriction endonuclease subunit R n=1 Tax=Xylanibacter muris TaxID=2736290 RepID=UPI000FFEEA45|nr:type I restriction endonuclease subunit R [Xylanibacter muris]RXE72078.1 type I restriction endonuclease subunit R [Muribaculaceae bacterium Isolate-002 (NCI)]
MAQYNNIIAESNNFIVLDEYNKHYALNEPPVVYQNEASLEREFIQDLIDLKYDYLPTLSGQAALLANVRAQLQELNDVVFTDGEWKRYVDEYLDKPNDTLIEKTRKLQDNHVYDFVFDDGHIKNIYLVDKEKLCRNKMQVISQFTQEGEHANRYDVTILVNGLPLVQVELKKRGVAIREAFNQVHRYSKESFNSDNSLYKYLQVFVISNGTDSRYFANTVERNKHSFDFTMNWANAKNVPVKDLKDFTATFFQKNTLLKVILTYSVFDCNNTLLIMRPYQIAAAERILWKIRSSHQLKKWSTPEGGGYIWHTTGSGKTLTSFKAARLVATHPDFKFIAKVFFVVDRKDLDYQTMKEYQRFSPDSVNGSESTAGLERNIDKDDNKIIVTTIQKLNNLMKSKKDLPIYNKEVVFIFDEAHRSQFGEAQKQLKKRFKKYYQFGFTGTPIFPVNAIGPDTTESVFGCELHSYIITDAIRDEKVLKFKVDYNNVRPRFRHIEKEQDEKKITALENRSALLHPARIKEISQYILDNFRIKTHRTLNSENGFNAMFAVSSIDAAKCYYEELRHLQKDVESPLKITTIFSFAANEDQCAIGEIKDENFEPSAMDSSAKEFLTKAINDYNAMFKTSYGVENKEFQNYYRDVAKRVKNKEIDLVIVVGMFLTGFDAPALNTIFVDKNLRYHGLIQAFSRTNRIFNPTKTFGNIVTFRDLEDNVKEAIKTFCNNKDCGNAQPVVLEKSFKEYLHGFKDIATGEVCRGYIEVVGDLINKFPNTDVIETEENKRDFSKLFGEYLRIENILHNYDEFTHLKALKDIDLNNHHEIEKFKSLYFLTDDDVKNMLGIDVLSERKVQDYKSVYNDIRDWRRRQNNGSVAERSKVNWDDIVFEIDLLKSQEINLDYILELIYEHNKKIENKIDLIEEIRRIIRASVGNRAKESLIVDYINNTNLDTITDKANILESFYTYARCRLKKEATALIAEENLNEEEARRYIALALKRGYVSENGTDLNNILPKMSPLNPMYLTKKHKVLQLIVSFVEKFKEIDRQL